MNEISRIKREIQLIVDLLQIKELDLSVARVKYSDIPEITLNIRYESAAGKAIIGGNMGRKKIAALTYDFCKIDHVTADTFNSEKIDLGADQKDFDEIIFRFMKIIEEYPYIAEVQDLFNLVKYSRTSSSQDNYVTFKIYKNISKYGELAGVKASYGDISFEFYREDNRWVHSYVSEDTGDETESYKMNELHKLLHAHNPKEVIRSAEKLRDYLFILDEINFAS